MNKKLLTAVIVLTVFACFAATHTAYAFGKHCDYGKKGSYCGTSESKFHGTIYKILNKRTELGLSTEQLSQIKALSSKVKKDLINRDAKIKTLKVEINTLMWEFPFDTEGVNELVAQQYSLKTEKTQYLISAYSQLAALLTEPQIQTMKEL